MTLETAQAILSTRRTPVVTPSRAGHTDAEQLAFEKRMARLRPRRFVRIMAFTH